jgi:hypothetical protein
MMMCVEARMIHGGRKVGATFELQLFNLYDVLAG